MPSADLVLAGSYDYDVAALSVVIAILGSYTALDLGERVTFARGGSRLSWLIGGCVAMGIGTWSMHYVGMLAFRLPVSVQYDWPTSLLSLLSDHMIGGDMVHKQGLPAFPHSQVGRFTSLTGQKLQMAMRYLDQRAAPVVQA